MSRLLRPLIPLYIKLYVALRQLGISEFLTNLTIAHAIKHRQVKRHLDFFLELLADKIGCPVIALDLDHHPALQNRKKVFRKGAHIEYSPRANDPAHLKWRPHGTEYAGSHKVKTLIRGDNGAYSDAALARKFKRIDKNREIPLYAKTRRKAPKKIWPSRPFPTGRRFNPGERP